jgi:hypothetical protein
MSTIWKCADMKCTWPGLRTQRASVSLSEFLRLHSVVCPVCGGSKFFWVNDGKLEENCND